MTLDEYLLIGKKVELGSHTFTADEIKEFAAKYDPQPFHMDEAAARQSVFGRLCASGWHTCAMWMRYNLARRPDVENAVWEGDGEAPVFGPSPGFTDLKWLKPVYVDETITFTRTAKAHRAIASRPGWRVMTLICEAFDSTGDKVLEFESAVLLKAD